MKKLYLVIGTLFTIANMSASSAGVWRFGQATARALERTDLGGCVGYRDLVAFEAQVADMQRDIAARGFTSAGVYSNFSAAGTGLGHFEYLQAWDQANARFHQARYDLMSEKQNYYMYSTYDSWHKLHSSRDSISSKAQKRAQKINEAFDLWQRKSDSLEEEFDPREQWARKSGFQDFGTEVRAYTQEQGIAPKTTAGVKAGWHRWIQGGAEVFGSGLSLFGQVIGRGMIPGHYPWFRDFTPFNSRFGFQTLTRGLLNRAGYNVEITGREHWAGLELRRTPGRRVVNLFLPSHRSNPLDAYALSLIDFPSLIAFGNPSAFVKIPGAPEFLNIWLASWIAKMPEFISVGKVKGWPKEPEKKLLQLLDAGLSINVLNFPQGVVADMGELLPINKTFVEKLLLGLINAGYEVNILPIAIQVGSNFMSASGGVDEPTIHIKILPRLLPAAVRAIVHQEIADHQKYFEHFLASLWLENLGPMGELSIQEMMDRSSQRLGITYDLDRCVEAIPPRTQYMN